MEDTTLQDLIYGKNRIERIVSMELEESSIKLFILNDDLSTRIEEHPYKYWLLTNKYYGQGEWAKLNGNQTFKYGRQFETKEEFRKARKYLWSRREIRTFSPTNLKEQCMLKDGYTYFKGLTPRDIPILSFDIESTGLRHDKDARIIIITNTFRKGDVIIKKQFCWDEYENCGELTSAWCKWVREMDPSLLCGHNIYGFDLPYIAFCAEKYGHKVMLGRDGSQMFLLDYESKFRVDGSKELAYHKADIYGREIVDTMFLAYRYDIGKKYESYGLKPIIKQEGLEKEGRVFYDAQMIRHNYKIQEEWEKIRSYAIDDSDDSLALYDLMIAPFFYMTRSVPKSFQEMLISATGSQMNSIMVRGYLQKAHSVAAPTEAEPFEGAISLGIPGIYRNTNKVDVASLYPSIMRNYKVFDSVKDPQQNFTKIVDHFTIERLKNKKLAKDTGEKYYDDLQASEKIAINSLYGFLGAPGLNYNYPLGAAEVTRRGRDILSLAVKFSTGRDISEFINKDTTDE
jgi:DNA polymerase I